MFFVIILGGILYLNLMPSVSLEGDKSKLTHHWLEIKLWGYFIFVEVLFKISSFYEEYLSKLQRTLLLEKLSQQEPHSSRLLSSRSCHIFIVYVYLFTIVEYVYLCKHVVIFSH